VRRSSALLSVVAAAALVAAALAGCAPTSARGAGNQPAGCTPALPSGDASSIVTSTGAAGKAPTTKFPTPIVASTDQATVVKAGHGMIATTGSQVQSEITVYDASTGDSVAATSYDGTSPLPAVAGVSVPGQQGSSLKSSLDKALVCAQAGARIALTTTGKRFGLLSSVDANASIVVVIDVSAVYLGKADGVNQLPKDGMPNVITAVDGRPGIVLQELEKPTSARSEVVKAGSGSVVKKGQTVVALYTAWTWPSGADKPTVVDSLDTWANLGASPLPLTAAGGLPAKLESALEGQKVGSQVLVVLPPKDGFGAADAQNVGVGTDDTLIFVVDILGIQH
jgi:co-chaperonin GroES (HSP10)